MDFSDGAPAPNAGAAAATREGEGSMAGAGGREGRGRGISEAELYRLLGRQHRHKFVLKVEKPRGRRATPTSGTRAPRLALALATDLAGLVKQMGCTVLARLLFNGRAPACRINNIAFSLGARLLSPRVACRRTGAR